MSTDPSYLEEHRFNAEALGSANGLEALHSFQLFTNRTSAALCRSSPSFPVGGRNLRASGKPRSVLSDFCWGGYYPVIEQRDGPRTLAGLRRGPIRGGVCTTRATAR
jgi:hypothetical protein